MQQHECNKKESTAKSYVKPELEIIIPVFNNSHLTKSLLQDLSNLSEQYMITIVDNNSSDNTGKIINEFWLGEDSGIKKLAPKFNYLKLNENKLHSGGCNYGFKRIGRGKNIMFLNNDVRVKSGHTDWPAQLIKKCQEGKMVGVNGGLLTPNFDFIRETNKFYDDPGFYISGWCVAASKETWDKLAAGRDGLWEERLFYFNDFDLTHRAKQLEIPLELIDLPLHHFGKATTKKMNNVGSMYLKSQKICREIWGKRNPHRGSTFESFCIEKGIPILKEEKK